MCYQAVVRGFILGLFVVAGAGCATQPPPAETVMSGSWSGGTSATSTRQATWYTMVLSDNAGVIDGSGTCLVGNYTDAITISGARSGDRVSLNIRYDSTEQDNFTGNFDDATQVSGTIAGSVNDAALVLSQ